MKLQELFLKEFDPVFGTAMANFIDKVGNDIVAFIDRSGAQPIDAVAQKVYEEFVKAFKAEIERRPAVRKAVDRFFDTYVEDIFKMKDGSIPDIIKNRDRSQLIRQGKLNSPYLLKLFTAGVEQLRKDRDVLGTGDKEYDPSKDDDLGVGGGSGTDAKTKVDPAKKPPPGVLSKAAALKV